MWSGTTRNVELQIALGLTLAGGISTIMSLPVVAFLVAVAGLSLGAWRISRSVFGVRLADDALLASTIIAVSWLVVVAECLSRLHWLGWSDGWLYGCLILYGLSLFSRPPTQPLDWRTPLRPLTTLSFVGRLVAVGFAIPLATISVLVWFSGITIADSLATYLPRAVHYLEDGTLEVYFGRLGYFPYLHTILVAFPMLFLRTDVHANVLSLLTAALGSVALAAFARSLGWHGALALVAAALPWTAPKFLISAPTSGFDILEGLWLVSALYFLRRGYAATSVRWLTLAALATALGLATKPTFWFAAPGLAVIWAVCMLRGVRRGRRQHVVLVVSMAFVAVLLIGAPFMIRNYVLHGYIIAPDSERNMLAGQDDAAKYSLDPIARARTFAVSALGNITQVVTPPFFLPESVNTAVDPWMHDRIRWLGAEQEFKNWPQLLRHGSERYHADHAGTGGAVPLVLIPALVALPFAGRVLGVRRQFLWWVVWLGTTYFLTFSYIIPISPNSNRYTLEWLMIAAAAAPVFFAALPRPVRGVVLCCIAIALTCEMYDTLRHSRHLPLNAVTSLSRADQSFAWFGWPTRATQQAARVLNQKYPPGMLPEVFTDARFDADYFFNGPSLARRTIPWQAPVPDNISSDRPVRLPGPLLTQEPALVDALMTQPDVAVERLSANTWLLHPLTKLVVLTNSVMPGGTGERVITLRAFVPPDWSERPEFRAVVLSANGTRELRQFQADPLVTVRLSDIGYDVLQVEARDGRQPDKPPLKAAFDWQYLGWLDAAGEQAADR